MYVCMYVCTILRTVTAIVGKCFGKAFPLSCGKQILLEHFEEAAAAPSIVH